jgi:alkylhydroperoxidase family enzyme
VEAVLADWRTAPVDTKLRAMLGLLQQVTLRPAEVGPDDAAAVRRTGVSDSAIVDALLVCTYFNLITRLADSFAFAPISDTLGREGLLRHEARFLERGYV